MSNSVFFLFIILGTVFILLMLQKVFIDITFDKSLKLEIEYFPFKLVFSDVGKNPKRKFKLKKLPKYVSRFSAFSKSAKFFLSHSEISEKRLVLPIGNNDSPDAFFVKKEALGLLGHFVRLLLDIFFESSNLSNSQCTDYSSDCPIFDFLISTRLFVLILSFFVFIFSLMKKGLVKKLVG